MINAIINAYNVPGKINEMGSAKAIDLISKE